MASYAACATRPSAGSVSACFALLLTQSVLLRLRAGASLPPDGTLCLSLANYDYDVACIAPALRSNRPSPPCCPAPGPQLRWQSRRVAICYTPASENAIASLLAALPQVRWWTKRGEGARSECSHRNGRNAASDRRATSNELRDLGGHRCVHLWYTTRTGTETFTLRASSAYEVSPVIFEAASKHVRIISSAPRLHCRSR